MLDIRRIRQFPSEMEAMLKTRRQNLSIGEMIAQDEERRKLLSVVEEKKALRNAVSKRIGAAKKKGSQTEELLQLTMEQRKIGEEIADLDEKILILEQVINEKLITLPNFLHSSVIQVENPIISSWGTPRVFRWEPKNYGELFDDLQLLVGNALRGQGAHLARSLTQFVLDQNVDNGYEEILVPQFVERNALKIAGYHPYDEKTAFQINEHTCLSPSASVPLVSMQQNQILDANALPASYCAFSPCFEEETKLLSQCQAHSVELLQMTLPDQSYDKLEETTKMVGALLKQLQLPYQIALRDAAATPFKSAKTYDIQVWMPSLADYVNISTCSNCEEYLARRAGIRFRNHPKEKPQYLHTISAHLSIETILAALLENNQNDDGSVSVPELLVPYMKTNLIR